ncbi:MAG: hypothetical protein ABIS68_04755 [Casimicrobiaceae bacterium]
MPSARDLLQQADALIRSNRGVGESGDRTVPVLTDVAIPGAGHLAARSRSDEIPTLTSVVGAASEPMFDLTIPSESAALARRFPPAQVESLVPFSEMPTLPQFDESDSIIARRRSESQIDRYDDDDSMVGAMPKWLEADLLSDAPIAAEPGASSDDESTGREPVALTDADATAQTDPEPTAQTDHEPRATARVPTAEEVAETVYYQVLQNLDLYTERALQEHLTTHLQPIIEQASRELLATLNANLGGLMRQYVAEAIEKQLGVHPVVNKLTPGV